MELAANLYEVDLHCHTTASDGALSPAELVQTAAELGLKGVGISDHDTISGWQEAEEAGKRFKIRLLRGIELNTDWDGREVHILGYEPDASSAFLKTQLKILQDARKQRMLEILDRLKPLGIVIAEEEVRQLAQGEAIGRPHIAQVLVARGYADSIKNAFNRYVGAGAPGYVPRYKLTPEQGIELIREARGVAVLAHPGVARLDDGIETWVEAGLQGIEVSHSEHSPEDERRYRDFAFKYRLLMTGGSDFHGEARKPGVKLGHWGVKEEVIDQIQALAGTIKPGI